ncbi:hypothetical protein ACWFRM_22205, partial [Streptomyces sp. NPDC055144]
MPKFQAVAPAAETPRQAVVPVLIYTLAGRVAQFSTAQIHHLKSHDRQRQLALRRKGGKGRVRPPPDRLSEPIDVTVAGRTEGPIPAPATPLADGLVWRPLQDAPLAGLRSMVWVPSRHNEAIAAFAEAVSEGLLAPDTTSRTRRRTADVGTAARPSVAQTRQGPNPS